MILVEMQYVILFLLDDVRLLTLEIDVRLGL